MKNNVLIVGAGPTSLVFALWLSKQGIPVRIIDKNTESSQSSRALGDSCAYARIISTDGFGRGSDPSRLSQCTAQLMGIGKKARCFKIDRTRQNTHALSFYFDLSTRST